MTKLSSLRDEGVSHNNRTNKDYTFYYFITRSLPFFTELEALFYQKLDSRRIKVVPANIMELLTPVSLAYWFMDDGNALGKGFQLNTNAFAKADLELLVNVLTNKFGLNCTIQSRNRIYITVKSAAKFIQLIEPYIVDSMRYKIGQ